MNENTFRLQLQSGPDAGRVYELTTDSLTLGRYPLADIVIDDPTVSYRHAVLTRRGTDTYRIADLGSDSGTYVNGQRIGAEPVALSPGDVILLGSRLSAAFLSDPSMTAVPEVEAIAPLLTDYQPLVAFEQTSEQAYAPEAGPSLPDEIEPPVGAVEEMPVEMVGANLDSEQVALVPRVTPTASGHAGPLPAMPSPLKNKNGRILLITAGCLIALLACCCSSTFFMYFIGGDWLLSQLGYLP